MNSQICRVLTFLNDEGGPTATEYAVLLAIIITVCLTVITEFGTNAGNTFGYVASQVGRTGS
jgi:pilus assembly protein Flp/PilA